MRKAIAIAIVAALGAVAGAVAASSAEAATSHSHKCHTQHTCPSDHASYRWKGWLCVKPSADERTAAFKKRVVYSGRTYLCKK